MNPGSCGTIFNLLVILLLLFCPRANAKKSHPPFTCPNPSPSSWWRPLGQDPCALIESLRQDDNISIVCCLKTSGMKLTPNGPPGNSTQSPGCGPCNLQTYNIASACTGCFFLPNGPLDLVEHQATESANSLFKVTLTAWKRGDSQEDSQNTFNGILIPPWASVPTDPNDFFDMVNVMQNASLSAPGSLSQPVTNTSGSQPTVTAASPSTSSSVTIPHVTPSLPSSASSPQQSTPSSPGSTSSPQKFASSSSRTGAIAGGVLGGALLLALIGLGAFCLVRRRLRTRIAPSAEFMPVVAPRPGMAIPPNEWPPPFSPGAWRDPVLEKVRTAESSQSALDAGIYAHPSDAAWKIDVEK